MCRHFAPLSGISIIRTTDNKNNNLDKGLSIPWRGNKLGILKSTISNNNLFK